MLKKVKHFHNSVIGLNFDFLSLNLIGFTLYGCFNIFLFWVDSIQARCWSFDSNVRNKQTNHNILKRMILFKQWKISSRKSIMQNTPGEFFRWRLLMSFFPSTPSLPPPSPFFRSAKAPNKQECFQNKDISVLYLRAGQPEGVQRVPCHPARYRHLHRGRPHPRCRQRHHMARHALLLLLCQTGDHNHKVGYKNLIY